MLYDYACSSCGHSWCVQKGMRDPNPSRCPSCNKKSVERVFDTPAILFANRPPWTYKDCLKFKDCKLNDGPRTAIDPSKHGDLGAWNSPGEVIPERKPKRKR